MPGLLKQHHRRFHPAAPDGQEFASPSWSSSLPSSPSSIPNEATGKTSDGHESADASASSQPHAAGRASEESEEPREDAQDEGAPQDEISKAADSAESEGAVGVDSTDGGELKGGAEANTLAEDGRGVIASSADAAAADFGTGPRHEATAPATGDHVSRPARGEDVGLAAPGDEADGALARDGDGVESEAATNRVHVPAEGATAVEDDVPSTTLSSTTQQRESTKSPSSDESLSAGEAPGNSPINSVTVANKAQNERDCASSQPDDRVDQDQAGVSSSGVDPTMSGGDAVHRDGEGVGRDDHDNQGPQDADPVPKTSSERSFWNWITRSRPSNGKDGQS